MVKSRSNKSFNNLNNINKLYIKENIQILVGHDVGYKPGTSGTVFLGTNQLILVSII